MYVGLCTRYGLQDYGIELNIREMDEIFNYFGTATTTVATETDMRTTTVATETDMRMLILISHSFFIDLFSRS